MGEVNHHVICPNSLSEKYAAPARVESYNKLSFNKAF
jgi:hypothetical protein